MPLTADTKSAIANSLRGVQTAWVAVFASLHSTTPSDLGSNEISGGSPAYSRQPVTFSQYANGILISNSAPTFQVPSGSSISHLGLWTAVSGGAFLGSVPAFPSDIIPGLCDHTTGTVSSPYHGYAANQRVTVTVNGDATLPSGVTQQDYYIVSPTANTYRLSLTLGGDPVSFASSGFINTQAHRIDLYNSHTELSIPSITVKVAAP